MSGKTQDASGFLWVILLILIALIARDLYFRELPFAIIYFSWSAGIITATIILCTIEWYIVEKRRLRASPSVSQGALRWRFSWRWLLLFFTGGYICISPFVTQIINDFPEGGLNIWPLLYGMLLIAFLFYPVRNLLFTKSSPSAPSAEKNPMGTAINPILLAQTVFYTLNVIYDAGKRDQWRFI